MAQIPAVWFLGVLPSWRLDGVGFVTGTLTVFCDGANQSYLPSIVERDELVEGNSKLQISQSAAQIGGPGIAGYLVGIVTAPVGGFPSCWRNSTMPTPGGSSISLCLRRRSR